MGGLILVIGGLIRSSSIRMTTLQLMRKTKGMRAWNVFPTAKAVVF